MHSGADLKIICHTEYYSKFYSYTFWCTLAASEYYSEV